MRSALKYGAILLGALVLLLACGILFFSGSLLNAYVKPRLVGAFSEAFPGYQLKLGEMRYSIWKNHLAIDLITVSARDASFECSMHAAAVSGIRWLHLWPAHDPGAEVYSDATVDAGQTVFTFGKARQELRLGAVHLSVPASELVARSVSYYQLIDDTRFFENSRFRQTRYRFEIPLMHLQGVDYSSTFRGTGYHVRSVALFQMSASILVNMDKPYDKKSSLPFMPNEALAAIRETIAIDSLNIMHGRFQYCEKYTTQGTPGVITFSDVHACARRIRNHAAPPDTIMVEGEGMFMNAGIMHVLMTIPLTEDDFSMRYSGSLGRMDIATLNAFLEAGEHRRITSGILHNASFHVDVHSGQADGSVRAVYENLGISVLDKQTGSAKGLMNRLHSYIGKWFVIRGTNLPDENGRMSIGRIHYNKKKDDYFFQFAWFALRGGVGDVVGF